MVASRSLVEGFVKFAGEDSAYFNAVSSRSSPRSRRRVARRRDVHEWKMVFRNDAASRRPALIASSRRRRRHGRVREHMREHAGRAGEHHRRPGGARSDARASRRGAVESNRTSRAMMDASWRTSVRARRDATRRDATND
jgi:hypothetical protein